MRNVRLIIDARNRSPSKSILLGDNDREVVWMRSDINITEISPSSGEMEIYPLMVCSLHLFDGVQAWNDPSRNAFSPNFYAERQVLLILAIV